MSWREFVVATMGGDQQQEAAAKASLNPSTISRWLNAGTPGEATNVAAFARGYGKPVLEAFVAAGFLSPEEAKARPQVAPDFTQLTNDELLNLVRARMREEGEGHADRPAATKKPAPVPAKKETGKVSDLSEVRSTLRQTTRRVAKKRPTPPRE